MSILYIYIYIYYGPEPHWGTVRKKMAPDKVYLSQVYYRIYKYIYLFDDYQIIIEVAQQE